MTTVTTRRGLFGWLGAAAVVAPALPAIASKALTVPAVAAAPIVSVGKLSLSEIVTTTLRNRSAAMAASFMRESPFVGGINRDGPHYWRTSLSPTQAEPE